MTEADKPIVPAMTADAGPLEAMASTDQAKALLPVTQARHTVKATGTAIVEFDGQAVIRVQKIWPDLDVMNLATCRTWVSRTFRKMLNEAAHDHIVSVSYVAQMKRSPHSFYSGGKSGVNGQIMRTDGDFYNG